LGARGAAATQFTPKTNSASTPEVLLSDYVGLGLQLGLEPCKLPAVCLASNFPLFVVEPEEHEDSVRAVVARRGPTCPALDDKRTDRDQYKGEKDLTRNDSRARVHFFSNAKLLTRA
jgi:hypothetical protein